MERRSRCSTAAGGVSNRTFEDYDPAVEWSHAAADDTATISLPGFRKEEVRVQVDSKGHLLVRGERPVEAGSSKWVRFSKDLMKLPDNCDTGGIRVAKFENSKLIITVPKKNCPSPPGSYALRPPPAAAQEEEEEGKGCPSPSGGSAPEPAPAAQEEEDGKGRPFPLGSYALEPAPAAQEEEGKGCPLPSGGSVPQPEPAVQEEEEEKKSRPSPPDGSAPETSPSLPPSLTQEEKNSLPSPPDGCVSERALAVQEEDEDEEGTTMVETEMAGGRRPIQWWLLVAVAALSFVGITAYVVWRKLRSGGSAAGKLAGAGSYIDEM